MTSRMVEVVDFGPVPVHAVSMAEAIDLIAERAQSGEGGFVLTPNLDHLSAATRNPEFAAAYRRCFLSLADGAPLVFLSRLLGLPVRHKVSGSDLLGPLLARCAADGLPVFFLGATATACEAAGRKLKESHPAIRLAGHDSSFFDLDRNPEQVVAALHRARDSGARLIVVCLPPAKQLLLHRFEAEYRPAVGIGAGSALSFYVGELKRAPTWMSRHGLEWLYRLVQEPGRLWRRYLVEPVWAIPVVAGMAGRTLLGKPPRRTARF